MAGASLTQGGGSQSQAFIIIGEAQSEEGAKVYLPPRRYFTMRISPIFPVGLLFSVGLSLLLGSVDVLAADTQIGEEWSYSAPEACNAFEKKKLSPELEELDQRREKHLYELLHMEATQALDPRISAQLRSILNVELRNSLIKYGSAVVRGCRALPPRALSNTELNQAEMETIGQIADIVSAADRNAICQGAVDNKAKLNTILQTRVNEKLALVTRAEVDISKVAVEYGAATRSMLSKIPVGSQAATRRRYLLPPEKAEYEKLLNAYFGQSSGMRKVEPKKGGGVYHHPGNPLIAFQKKLQEFREGTQRTLNILGDQELYREDARARICSAVNTGQEPRLEPQLVAPPRPASRPKKK